MLTTRATVGFREERIQRPDFVFDMFLITHLITSKKCWYRVVTSGTFTAGVPP
jgi:hypothetical protein